MNYIDFFKLLRLLLPTFLEKINILQLIMILKVTNNL